MVDSAALRTALIPQTEANRDRTDGVPKPSPNRTKALVGYCYCRRTEAPTSAATEPVFGRELVFQTSYAGSIPVARSIPAPATEPD
jgi:hypothetical protein